MPASGRPQRHKPWAYAALMSLDVNALKRRELAAAGVPEHRIDALYPACFADLTPGLKQLLAEQGEHIYLRDDNPKDGDPFDDAMQTLWDDEERQFSQDMEEDAALDDLHEHLMQTWQLSHPDEKRDLTVGYPMTVWSAWWFMQNYAHLTEAAQAAGDKLLLEADRLWRFSKPRGSDV